MSWLFGNGKMKHDEKSVDSFDSEFSDDNENYPPPGIVLTENGAPAFESTGTIALDFFTRIVRGAPVTDYVPLFIEIFNGNNKLAMQVLYNLRDIRDGKGEKLIPRVLLFVLKFSNFDVYKKVVLELVKDYGCWKDLLFICELTKKFDEKMSNSYEISLFADQLSADNIALDQNVNAGISLAAKWAPSEKTHYDRYPLKLAKAIADQMNMNSKEYRKMLSKLRNHLKVLESFMCNHEFHKIDFSHLPSVAHNLYRKAFLRDTNAKKEYSEDREDLKDSYEKYLSSLQKGETKINSGALHPHQITKSYMKNPYDPVDITLEEQWKNISKDIKEKGTFKKTMAVVDVSGSMNGEPMEVAIALGILVAECVETPFNNRMITFHESPNWFTMKGETLKEKVQEVKNMSWGGTTDIVKVFDLILDHAKTYSLTQDQMIETLFIFTDMQFDDCRGSGSSYYASIKNVGPWETTFKTIEKSYNDAGYTPPRIICWNLRTSGNKTLPFSDTQQNVASLSGFSSQLLKSVMNMEDITPLGVFKNIMEKYNPPDFNKALLHFGQLSHLEKTIKEIKN